MSAPDLSLGLAGTHVLLTGGAGLIGRVVGQHFLAAGAHVSSLDIAYTSPAVGDASHYPNLITLPADIACEASMTAAWNEAVARFGPVECCVALASRDLSVLPHHASAGDMSLEQFNETLATNVGGTFLTARCWLRGLRDVRDRVGRVAEGETEGKKRLRNVSLVIVGSESGHFGERGNPDYAAAKSAVQGGLLQSLRADAPRVWEGARVNAIAPGPVDTARFKDECAADPEQYWLDCQGTTALGTPVAVESVAKSILFLASENFSGHVHGHVLNVDSGKQGKVMWTKEELNGRAQDLLEAPQ